MIRALCSSGLTNTCYVDQAVLKLTDPLDCLLNAGIKGKKLGVYGKFELLWLIWEESDIIILLSASPYIEVFFSFFQQHFKIFCV